MKKSIRNYHVEYATVAPQEKDFISAGQKPGFKASPKKKKKENVSSKGLDYRTIGSHPQTLILFLTCLPWPSHSLTPSGVLPWGAYSPS